MLSVGPRSVAYFLYVIRDCVCAHCQKVGKWLGKAQLTTRQTQDIVQHEHLSVASGSCSDANCRNRQFFCDFRSKIGWYSLNDHGACAGIFDSVRIL